MKRLALTLTLAAFGTLIAGAGMRGANDQNAVDLDPSTTAIKAQISGIEEGGAYPEIPPVLVELTGLKRGEDVWVELHHGAANPIKPGVTLVNSKAILWMDEVAVMNVPGLTEACRQDGTWTLVVMTANRDRRELVAKITFASDQRATGAGEGLVFAP